MREGGNGEWGMGNGERGMGDRCLWPGCGRGAGGRALVHMYVFLQYIQYRLHRYSRYFLSYFVLFDLCCCCFCLFVFLSRVWLCRPSCRKLVQESTTRLTPSRVNPFCLLSIFIFLLHIILGVYNVGMRRRCRPCRYPSTRNGAPQSSYCSMLLHIAPYCLLCIDPPVRTSKSPTLARRPWHNMDCRKPNISLCLVMVQYGALWTHIPIPFGIIAYEQAWICTSYGVW